MSVIRISPYLRMLPGLILGLYACSYLPEDIPGQEGLRVEETRETISLAPEQDDSLSATGLIFYPGALVDPHAYLGWAGDFALSGPGHRIIIVKMPANLAVLAPSSAGSILEHEKPDRWVIGGHSLGGAMACSMVGKEKSLFEGLVLMAAYPAESVDLSDWSGQVLSLSGSNDRIVDSQKFTAGKEHLPPQTLYYEILGGNHAGFGSYGLQEGDGEAGISTETQHQQIVLSLVQFFESHGLD